MRQNQSQRENVVGLQLDTEANYRPSSRVVISHEELEVDLTSFEHAIKTPGWPEAGIRTLALTALLGASARFLFQEDYIWAAIFGTPALYPLIGILHCVYSALVYHERKSVTPGDAARYIIGKIQGETLELGAIRPKQCWRCMVLDALRRKG